MAVSLVNPAPPAEGFDYFGLRGWTRNTIQKSTASLADDATENGLVNLYPGWRIYAVEMNVPMRLRLYATTGQRTIDASRPIGTDPDTSTDHGLFFEYVSDSLLLGSVLSPIVHGYVPGDYSESLVGVPYAITNLSGSASVCTVDFLVVRTE